MAWWCVLLGEPEFGHGLVDGVLGDFVLVVSGGVDEGCGGDVVDVSWEAGGVFVDEVFGLGFEELWGGAAVLDALVDVGGGLVFGEGLEVGAYGNAVGEVGVGFAGEQAAQGLLSAQDHFEFGGIIDGGAEEEA